MEQYKKNAQILIFSAPEPDTELSQLLSETFDLAQRDPKILELINHDQDVISKEKKKIRIEDKQRWENKLTPFPELSQVK